MDKNSAPLSYQPTNVWMPKSLQEAWQLKQRYGSEAAYISGGTLMQLKREQGVPFPHYLISLEAIKELHGIQQTVSNGKDRLSIGALTTLSACLANEQLDQSASLLVDAIRSIAAPAVRNRATIGGNLVYGIGDTIPALLAMDAEITWYDGEQIKSESLYQCMEKGEVDFSTSILLSIQLPSQPIIMKVLKFYKKIGRREAFIPSLVTVSGYGWVNADQEIEEVRLAVGGGAHIPQRLKKCEQLLRGKKLTISQIDDVYERLIEEYQPNDDPFATANYKKQVAFNIIHAELERLLES